MTTATSPFTSCSRPGRLRTTWRTPPPIASSGTKRCASSSNVRGGNREPGTIVASPYLEQRGVLVALRGTGNGTFRESVDLAADFRRAFGTPPGVLLGLGISADSDDTNGVIEAELGDLVIE